MNGLINANRKAIVGLLTPIIVLIAAKAGLNLPDEVAAGIATALTGLAVWLVPNTYGTGIAQPRRSSWGRRERQP